MAERGKAMKEIEIKERLERWLVSGPAKVFSCPFDWKCHVFCDVLFNRTNRSNCPCSVCGGERVTAVIKYWLEERR